MRHPGGLGDNFWGDVSVKTVPEVLGVDGEIINSVGTGAEAQQPSRWGAENNDSGVNEDSTLTSITYALGDLNPTNKKPRWAGESNAFLSLHVAVIWISKLTSGNSRCMW